MTDGLDLSPTSDATASTNGFLPDESQAQRRSGAGRPGGR
jgi:hypothetical protein